MYIVVGLGNPGEEYEDTRHNTGRMCEEAIEKKLGDSKKLKFAYLETFMNDSGPAVAKALAGKKGKKDLENLIIIHDDLDLPIGAMKLQYNRGSGGHRGVESIIKALKTTAFIRIRVGISPTTPSGKLKKPKTESDVKKFILNPFKPAEKDILKKVFKRATEAVETITTEGLQKAMTEANRN